MNDVIRVHSAKFGCLFCEMPVISIYSYLSWFIFLQIEDCCGCHYYIENKNIFDQIVQKIILFTLGLEQYRYLVVLLYD